MQSEMICPPHTLDIPGIVVQTIEVTVMPNTASTTLIDTRPQVVFIRQIMSPLPLIGDRLIDFLVAT
jgi:hypothetical protein